MIRRLLLSLYVASTSFAMGAESPNIILVFCDDLGYGDVGSYGSTKNRTPHLDEMAKEGVRFTDFYASSPVCTPSRASLLTGCYARRVGLHEAETGHWVLIPANKRGMNPDELTMAEMLKAQGYATACIGKWHLGDQEPHLPTNHGFDYYYGIPYSNDMDRADRGDPPLPLVRDTAVIEAPADQSTLTKRYTEEAVAFIEKNQSSPFFIYLPHTFPHLPLFASPDFLGKSANGVYGDSIEEIDWSTGEILKALDQQGLRENTLVIFTSDNGSNGRNGGSNAPLSGIKGSTMEGGMRVPMIARWPKMIPGGAVVKELATTMDFLPTFAALTGATLPGQDIDGYDISQLLFATPEAKSPWEVLYFYRRRQLQAIRYGDWKWHLPLEQTHPKWTSPEAIGKGRKGMLINLSTDLQEKNDLTDEHPEIIIQMKKFAAEATAQLGNDAEAGRGQRKAFDVPTSVPMTLEER